MTEDLTTDLSKISGLDILSRSITSGYKGRSVDVREVGKTLNVDYVIEGSGRKVCDQIRINVQLVDAKTGAQIWAERYDGSVENIFALQDRMLRQIVDSLTVKLSEEERSRLAARGTFSVVAHDLYLKGLYQESLFTRAGNDEALRLYEQALSIDPDYPLPYARMANIIELGTRNGWSDDIEADLRRAVSLAKKAVELDPMDPGNHWSFGRAIARLGEPGSLEKGMSSLETAIQLDPDFADAYAFRSVLFVADGRAEDGLRSVETAMALNPNYPFWYIFMRGMTRFVVEDYEAAIEDFEAAMERSPTALFVQWWLAAAYAQVGRIDDAEWQVEELVMSGFDGSIETIMQTQPIKDPVYLERYRTGLLLAGIPE